MPSFRSHAGFAPNRHKSPCSQPQVLDRPSTKHKVLCKCRPTKTYHKRNTPPACRYVYVASRGPGVQPKKERVALPVCCTCTDATQSTTGTSPGHTVKRRHTNSSEKKRERRKGAINGFNPPIGTKDGNKALHHPPSSVCMAAFSRTTYTARGPRARSPKPGGGRGKMHARGRSAQSAASQLQNRITKGATHQEKLSGCQDADSLTAGRLLGHRGQPL
jgi:hypothetical protein